MVCAERPQGGAMNEPSPRFVIRCLRLGRGSGGGVPCTHIAAPRSGMQRAHGAALSGETPPARTSGGLPPWVGVCGRAVGAGCLLDQPQDLTQVTSAPLPPCVCRASSALVATGYAALHQRPQQLHASGPLRHTHVGGSRTFTQTPCSSNVGGRAGQATTSQLPCTYASAHAARSCAVPAGGQAC